MATILLVDDEASARLTLGLLLKRRGHQVREADGVVAAAEALTGATFDLVITDLWMPDGQGLEVLQTARVRCPDANVILLTAHPGWESAREAMRLGAFDYFEKGQEPDGLFQRIDKALAEQEARRRRPPDGLEPLPALPRPVPDGERRYLTVLFADMRESMELLARRDLEEARQVLDGVIERMMDGVHGAGGTVNQVMGDGIMALFGAPAAQQDHAVRACRAALSMQESVARYAVALRRCHDVGVQIRVGINSGEVIVRAVGSDLRWDYTAVGMPTHIAARMEQVAAPGAILVTRETLNLVGGQMRSRPLGRVMVKGVPDGLEAYEIVGLRPKPEASTASPLMALLPNPSM
ncbi:MAG TPA: adenylate/guanylate cyclase domain-containing protein [Candidatus Methylomirabilis sp.]|nr:adenylate/guanylate cyclase domain-containing protein [Candidatus Methylomirabilis sp.]